MNLVSFLRSVSIFLATLALAWSQTVPNSNASANSANSKDAPVPSDQTLKQVPGPRSQEPDPLLDLPRLKQNRASLIGGTVENIDRLRDRFTLRPFGRGKLTIVFDPRTQFVRGEKPAGAEDIHSGDRVYVETVLDGTAVFAKTIHVFTGAALGTTVGQIIAYDTGQGTLSIRDRLSSRPVHFRVTSHTIVTGAGVGPGALVEVSFLGGKGPALVSEILVMAAPGSVFTFSGRITFLDFASHELVLANSVDDNRYEIQFNPSAVEADTNEHLQEGANVTIAARFNGQRYVAESVTMLPHSAE
jgi:hypothetical protein